MSRHRLSQAIARTGSGRRRLIVGGVSAALLAGMVVTALPLLADDQITVSAIADTTATDVAQDGDNAVKTTLATCPALCERNPRGARDAIVEFTVENIPATVRNLRVRLQMYSWQDFDARVSAHSTSLDAHQPRPPLAESGTARPGGELAAVPQVRKGHNEWDVSSLVTGNGTYTLALRQEELAQRVYWPSVEYRDPSIRPQLLISFESAAGAPSSPPVSPSAPPASPSAPPSAPVPTAPPASATPTAGPTAAPSPSASPPAPGVGCGSVSDLLVPSCGAWWGMYSPTSAAKGWDHGAAVGEVEAQVGRKFDIVHRYHDFSNSGSNGAFPDEFEQEQMRAGRLMFFAWESRVFSTGTTLTWRDVYSGRYDSVIDDVAGRIKATGVPVFMGFDHEPEDEPAKGSDAEFVRAWRYVYERFAKVGADNAVWVWTMMGWSGHYDRYAGLYPGDAYVDWVAYDPYNFYACNGGKTWKDPHTTVNGFYRWLDDNRIGVGKPRMLAEFGTNFNPDDPAAKQRWFEQFPAAIKAHPKIKAVIYFNSAGSTTTSATCNMTMNHTPSALAGFTKAGKDSYFNQPLAVNR
ncbi:glycoside hydrolase family 26 protein [Micromonospora sp. NBC_01813]|uniref:glycoside hydrolase family 26 protein n=1 Tax=Micromonospora sp. NBC_01813 TaxID=2975988 RepID=UPI002DDBF530|nr:glycosyl hydrolase [Micromonospora sp. NBC_01813]WSA12119.1 glycosyl hydrolase [Micromonospora sp. NBC_01813]